MSESERIRLVQLARMRGFSDVEILKDILQGTGGDERRKIIVEWSAALGLSDREALQLAKSANLIPSTHPPRVAAVAAPGTPQHIDQESADE